MGKMKKLRTALYGGVGTTRQRAETILCDHCDECSLYKKGCCLRVTSPFAFTNCIYGETKNEYGYVRKSLRYLAFENKIRADDAYANKLSRPASPTVAEIGDYIFVNSQFFDITEVNLQDGHTHVLNADDRYVSCESGRTYKISQACFSQGVGFVYKEDFEDLRKNGILYKILTSCPYSLFEHEKIEGYQREVVPDLVLALKKAMPKFAKRFFERWPTLDKTPNFVGKKAYVATMPQGSVIKDSAGNRFVLQSDELVCDRYKNPFLPFKAMESELRIKLTGDEVYEIKDNSEVDADTKIVGID